VVEGAVLARHTMQKQAEPAAEPGPWGA
jgi:hypothetical protein